MKDLHFLFIADSPPCPDQASGDLRFFSIMSMLATRYRVTLAVNGAAHWRDTTSNASSYERAISDNGVVLHEGDIHSALVAYTADIVIFEFYYNARSFITMARRILPHACMVVDSVDVHFKRFETKAVLSRLASDQARAATIKQHEIEAYKQSDLIIAISSEDKNIIQTALPDAQVAVLPNVHEMHPRPVGEARRRDRLVFVGGFKHEPNVDAILYFVTEVLPLIHAAEPTVVLSIIGSHPPPEITSLAGPGVEILGFVPDTTPYLRAASISIAPLRYGGGMKGKVGEALSHGLPVVTTRFGAEGFGLTPGTHLLVADGPAEFANAVIRLISDNALYERLSEAGYKFIDEHYSTKAMAAYLDQFVAQARAIKPKRLSAYVRLRLHLKNLYDKHIGWRVDR